jgi:hypothetical protein
MPKLKTGLLVLCAKRNARGASKETKERASDLATFVAGFAWPGCSDVGECPAGQAFDPQLGFAASATATLRLKPRVISSSVASGQRLRKASM